MAAWALNQINAAPQPSPWQAAAEVQACLRENASPAPPAPPRPAVAAGDASGGPAWSRLRPSRSSRTGAAGGRGGAGTNADPAGRALPGPGRAGTPQDAEAHYLVGLAYSELGRWEEAIASYKQAIGCKPDLAEAHANLGVASSQTGRHQEALVFLNEAVRLKPDLGRAYANLGVVYGAVGPLGRGRGRFDPGAPPDAGGCGRAV